MQAELIFPVPILVVMVHLDDDFVQQMQQASGLVEFTTSRQGTIIFDAVEATEAAGQILERYCIPRDRSSDLVVIS